MKITTKSNNVMFKDLKLGDVFKRHGVFYMRIRDIELIDIVPCLNAVHISDGYTCYVSDDECITLINGSFVEE